MVSAIILLLVLLTVGLVAGVFVSALIELKQIDEISEQPQLPSELSPPSQIPASWLSASGQG